MLDIKIDLKQNFYDFIKREVEHLKESGFEFPDNKKDDGYKIAEYFNLLERIPEQVPRKIYKCSSFICPEKYKEVLKIIEDDIISGNSLFKYLSTNIFKAAYSDGMQFDFGITHFHLGIKPHKKFPELVERTDDLLYCIYTYEAMYFIVIDRHGRWNDTKLLEQIQKEYPEILRRYEMNVIELTNPVISENQRKILREKHVNSFIQINGKVYMSPGGGVASNGFSTKGELRFINHMQKLSKLQNEMNIIFACNNKYFSECIPFLKCVEFNYISFSKPLVFIDNTFKYKMIVNWEETNFSSITIDIKEIKPY